jgi:hypothetical protein
MSQKNKVMENIKVFTSKFIQRLGQRLESEDVVRRYIEGKSPNFSNADIRDTALKIESFPELDSDDSPFENAKILYESLRNIDRTMASDQRLWTWLAHVPYMKYMAKRWPVADQPKEKRAQYIAQHWFVGTQTTTAYLRHGIGLLWWGAHMTYDEKRSDPFELTREFFSLYEYSRLLPGSLGKSDIFVNVLLDFVKNQQEHFSKNKEDKVRALMRRLNFVGAYKLLPTLDEKQLKNVLEESIS